MKNLLCLLSLLACHHLFAQDVRYIKAGGTGDGSTWQSASGNLQAAINASAPDDEIWVAAGVYKPVSPINDPLNTTSSEVSRLYTFTMKTGVKLYGGFPATGAPTIAERDMELYETTLSGDIGTVEDASDNCHHVCFFPNTENVLVDGFTIRDGNANASSFDYMVFVPSLNMQINNYQGAAIFIQGGNNEIRNCKIINNTSLYGGGAGYSNGGSHTFINNVFEGNTGRVGGGALLLNSGVYALTSNQFLNNEALVGINLPFPMPSPGFYSSGAGVSATNASVNFSFNHFENNHASVTNNTLNARGGAISLSGGTHSILNNTFVNNSATYLPEGVQVCNGGAIYVENGTTEIANCEFYENLSHGSGGAVYLVLGTHQISQNRFSANESIGNGGALLCSSISANITNNIFDANTISGNGGAIHSAGNTFGGANFYVNNTFYKNTNTTPQGTAGISLDGGIGHVLNNVFYQNTTNGGTNATAADFQFYNASGSTFLNNIYQSGISYPEQGIIGTDGNNNPLFVDADNGDFSLLPSSPCIGAGSNIHYLEAYPTTDFLGNERIQNGTIDLGAIEFSGDPLSNARPVDKSPSLQAYPNPLLSGQNLNIRAAQPHEVQLIDVTGKVLETITCTAGHNAFMLSHPQGIYFLKSSKGTSQKLIIY